MDFLDIKKQIDNNDLTNVSDSLLFVRKKIRNRLFIYTPIFLLLTILSFIFYNKNFNDNYFNQKIYIVLMVIFTAFYFILLGIEIVRSIYYIYKDSKDIKKLKTNYLVFKLIDNLFSYLNIIFYVMFIFEFILSTATVKMSSMYDTLEDNDRLIIYHLTHNYEDNDIIILTYNNYQNKHRINGDIIIKRIVAKPGDIVEIKYELINGGYTQVLYVNEERIEDYRIDYHFLLTDKDGNDYYKENEKIVMPDNLYIILGDNRRDSTDSRHFGLISKEDIIGKAILRFYPIKNMKIVR